MDAQAAVTGNSLAKAAVDAVLEKEAQQAAQQQAILNIQSAQMGRLVELLITEKMENEIKDAVLDIFHLPHTTEVERTQSIATLEAKFQSVAGRPEVVASLGADNAVGGTGADADVAGVAEVIEIIGGNSGIQYLIEKLLMTEETYVAPGADGELVDNPATANVDESVDNVDVTTLKLD